MNNPGTIGCPRGEWSLATLGVGKPGEPRAKSDTQVGLAIGASLGNAICPSLAGWRTHVACGPGASACVSSPEKPVLSVRTPVHRCVEQPCLWQHERWNQPHRPLSWRWDATGGVSPAREWVRRGWWHRSSYSHTFCQYSFVSSLHLLETILKTKSSAELPLLRHGDPVLAGNLRSRPQALASSQGGGPGAVTLQSWSQQLEPRVRRYPRLKCWRTPAPVRSLPAAPLPPSWCCNWRLCPAQQRPPETLLSPCPHAWRPPHPRSSARNIGTAPGASAVQGPSTPALGGGKSRGYLRPPDPFATLFTASLPKDQFTGSPNYQVTSKPEFGIQMKEFISTLYSNSGSSLINSLMINLPN